MAKWDLTESVLDAGGYSAGDSFTAGELAETLGEITGEHVSRETASDLIQAYLAKQRSQEPPRFQLTRSGRTRSAVWTLGARESERKRLQRTFRGDVQAKLLRAFAPDMRALGRHNPKQAAEAERIIRACTSVCVELLDGVLG